MSSSDGLVLAGVRVVDFSINRAAPHCATMMAALGAEVIKVESRMRIDAARGKQAAKGKSGSEVVTDPDKMERGYAFHAINTGKLGVRVNLKSPGSREVVRRLVEISDVVIEAFTPGVMEGLGLGFQELRRWRADLIVLSLSGFGRGGPESGYRAYAPVFAAAGGLSLVSGYRDGPPMEFIGSIDSSVGTHALMAVLAALVERDRTGRGQHIDVSGSECVTALLGGPVMDYALNGQVPERDGNRRPGMAPNNTYQCRNPREWISIAVATDEEWRSLCQVMGRPELATHPQYRDADDRKAHEEVVDEIVGSWTASLGAYEAMELLQATGVAAVPSFRADQLFHDPHVHARQGWVRLHHPVQGERHELRAPWRFADGGTTYRPAPLMGQHEGYVFGEVLGMEAVEMERLREQRVVY